MSRLDIHPATPGAPSWPCCHCCQPADWDALGYTVSLPGCPVRDTHPAPCVMCGQRTIPAECKCTDQQPSARGHLCVTCGGAL